jgi:hypothetical protein
VHDDAQIGDDHERCDDEPTEPSKQLPSSLGAIARGIEVIQVFAEPVQVCLALILKASYYGSIVVHAQRKPCRKTGYYRGCGYSR